MYTNKVKKIAAVHDLSGAGRVSLTVVIPILSSMGFQVCPLPTAVLSSHTQYPHFSFLDLTDEMPKIISEWKQLGVQFDAIYTGYLGSPRQIQIVSGFIDDFRQSFCGLLVKASLVREIGLPKTEYFIWFDDTEYCMRFHSRSRILNVNTAVLNHRTAPPGDAPTVSWKNYYGFRNAIDIGKTYSRHPFLYMAYIILNHLAHIVLDSLLALLGNQPAMRRYRAGIYKAVLKGLRQTPNGICKDYLPGSGKRI